MKKIILIGMMAFTMDAAALGIHADELKVSCKGTVKATEVADVGVSGSFYDRAGNYHPPTGYAYINYEVGTLGQGCADFEEKYNFKLTGQKYKNYKVFIEAGPIIPFEPKHTFGPVNKLGNPVDIDFIYTSIPDIEEKDVFKEAKKEIGKVYDFELKQHIHNKQSDGFMPFYPLIYSESFQLQSKAFGHVTLKVSVDKKDLSYKEKIELADAFFDFISQGDYKGLGISSILKTVLENAPSSYYDFKGFLPKALKLYEKEELKFDGAQSSYKASSSLYYLSEFVKKHSSNSNWNKYIKTHDFLLEHPSLFHKDIPFVSKFCFDIDAVELENFLEDLEYAFFSNSLTKQQVVNWEKPLKSVTNPFHGKCLNKVASKFSGNLAKELLEKYY